MGSLTPGKYADFVILDRDIMTVSSAAILGTRVLATYIGGKAVYENENAKQQTDNGSRQ
ncbi:MAG TPA: amidohydrolase family protein [Gemmatimonadaceae bacterium]|nr:amidohydrolase family protein [Gemmatimonadaceae bacterium]